MLLLHWNCWNRGRNGTWWRCKTEKCEFSGRNNHVPFYLRKKLVETYFCFEWRQFQFSKLVLPTPTYPWKLVRVEICKMSRKNRTVRGDGSNTIDKNQKWLYFEEIITQNTEWFSDILRDHSYHNVDSCLNLNHYLWNLLFERVYALCYSCVPIYWRHIFILI